MRAGFGISNTPFQDNNYAFNYPVRQNISFNPANSYVAAPANLENRLWSRADCGDPGERHYCQCTGCVAVDRR